MDSGHKVRIFARTPENNYNNESVQFYEGSILDEESVLKASEGVDGIFHLAAQVIHSRLPAHADTVRASAVVGTMNVMRAASKVKCRVVYASTSGTVGCSRTPTTANDSSPYVTEIVKHWPYYMAKIEAEMKAKKFAKEKGVELVIIRPTMMFGPGDDRCLLLYCFVG
uniref:NAD-dependent epimerase/dehydratase domain-containing protein n=1 Tax=Arcella intermedia TaxID=1963864 RepID=A0A6B2LL93_9EUKA